VRRNSSPATDRKGAQKIRLCAVQMTEPAKGLGSDVFVDRSAELAGIGLCSSAIILRNRFAVPDVAPRLTHERVQVWRYMGRRRSLGRISGLERNRGRMEFPKWYRSCCGAPGWSEVSLVGSLISENDLRRSEKRFDSPRSRRRDLSPGACCHGFSGM